MSSEVVIAPDVEAVVLNYLRPLLGVPASTNIPNPRPEPAFLRVFVVPSTGLVDHALYEALVEVEAWHTSRPAASLLARRAAAYLNVAPTFYARSGGIGWLPDPDVGTPRYVFTAPVTIGGTIL